MQALDPGALVDLLGGRLALRAEAVHVFQVGEEFFGVADFVDTKFKGRHVARK